MPGPTALELHARAFWGASRALSKPLGDDDRQFVTTTLGLIASASGGKVAGMAARRLAAFNGTGEQPAPPWGWGEPA